MPFVPQPPVNTPLVDARGFMSQPWLLWIQQAYVRMGSANAVSNIDLNKTMATTLLAGPIVVGDTNILVYKTPVGLTTVIDELTVENVNGVPAVINLWIVPVGDVVADKYQVFSREIGMGATATVPLQNITYGSEAELWASTTTGLTFNVNLNGRKVS